MAEPERLGKEEVRRALLEDRAAEDQTTRLLGTVTRKLGTLRFVAEGRFVVAGVPVAGEVFAQLDEQSQMEIGVQEGVWAHPGDTLVTVRARTGALLSGERVALNFLQRLCGVATLTRRAVDAVHGKAKITHTRKTTPGLRALERYAVLVGGGVENRASLADAVMWKDNHWELMAARGGGPLADALKEAPRGLPVIVEVETQAQLEEALAAGVKHLLIDNQPPPRVAEWAKRAAKDVTIQASGGITLENVASYAAAGAQLISMGALTHSAPSVSITCELSPK
ncbi:MAG TPA: carboxylating nicotinate-nucleotide diphosphorylase [Gemmatimonadales bacterium]|nr:carboxylating nicotinate-nucleotide diphosphorylase [Gemmatimonadales bacterium]